MRNYLSKIAAIAFLAVAPISGFIVSANIADASCYQCSTTFPRQCVATEFGGQINCQIQITQCILSGGSCLAGE